MTQKNALNINKIGQIAIAVDDITKARKFYQHSLGLPLLFDAGDNLSFYDCGGVRLMLTTLQGPEQDHNTSVIYYKVDDIQGSFERLKQKQVHIEREPQLAATMADHQLWIGFVRDPSQNLIGIMAELPLES